MRANPGIRICVDQFDQQGLIIQLIDGNFAYIRVGMLPLRTINGFK